MKPGCLATEYPKLLLVTVPLRVDLALNFDPRPPLRDGYGRALR